jgi:RHS repeat-associated protein
MVVMQAGDWMNYTVNVSQAGSYTVTALTYYWGPPGGTFHLEADGVNVTGPVQLPGNSSWQTVTKTGVQLTAGPHLLRLVDDTNGAAGDYLGCIDYLSFSLPADPQSLAMALIDPFNQTGNQLQARDAEWNLPLLSLPGRAGLDLGLTLSYSSLVWTRAGNSVYFDADNGSPSPGFRLGFPTIGDVFHDPDANVDARLLITSSGRRVELRKLGNYGSYDLYQAADSSYLQLMDYGSSLWVRTTDGMTMNYGPAGGEWHCALIRDRNGNMITAGYNGYGDITSVTDTLGRVINFNYDTNANLISITQSWNGQTHTWATFGWGDPLTLHPGFSGVSVVGAQDNEQVAVLRQVGLADGSRYNFDYRSNGQVEIIHRTTSDNVERSYTKYVYDTPADDCPRVTAARVFAKDWSDLYGVPHEVVTSFADLGSGWHQMVAPDGTDYRELYGTSGWQRGLTLSSEVWSSGARQKWTTVNWTQDNALVSYQLNPRVVESVIDDLGGNHRRTTVDYGSYAAYGLPYCVTEYANNGSSPMRQTYTIYDLSQQYLDWHILGLVSEVKVYDSVSGQYLSRTTYGHDNSSSITAQATTATQHDQSFNTSQLVRGNVTSVSRWDTADINNGAKALTASVTYDAAGSVLSTTDPAGHGSSIIYSDSFFDGTTHGINHNTFAYPTRVNDPDFNASTAPNNYSTAEYNYDLGAVTQTKGAPPAGQSTGIVQTITYDNAARVDRVTVNNGAYTRYLYDVNSVHQYSTVNSLADEAYAARFFDGAGRLIFDEANHPGSGGQYRAVYMIYDAMGRLVKQSNPTEITSAATPTGDDSGGWQFTTQTYDWKGRPLRTIHPDGYYTELSYAGCGCAGGEVVTATDEVGRRRRTTSDVLGRMVKSEELNWDSSVYSTADYVYDALDQIKTITHELQQRSFDYDGYGRLHVRTTPEQGATTYAYNSDDTLQSMTDARGAVSSYVYNNRHLVTNINYTVTGTVAATPNVSLSYDAAGNRTSMTDGLGSASYGYDSLSRMTSETRTFTGVGSYSLYYGYNYANELTDMSNSWGVWVGYQYDSNGRLNRINAANVPDNVTTLGYGMTYRAFGAVKSMTFGDHQSLSTSYDNRMRPASWNVSNVLGFSYTYNGGSTVGGNNQVSYARNLSSNGGRDSTLDRSYEYDQVGALVFAHSGAEARAAFGIDGQQWGTSDGPYSHEYDYDKHGNMTRRFGWGGDVQGGGPNGGETDFVYSYPKNQRTDLAYDLAGNVTSDASQWYTYDATGQQATANALGGYQLQQFYDGNGLRAKKSDAGAVTYYLRSTVLGGQIVAEMDYSGNFARGYTYAGADLLTVQQSGHLYWVHEDPFTKSKRTTDVNGAIQSTVELDPWGANTDRSYDAAFQPQTFTTYTIDANGGFDAKYRRYSVTGRFAQPDPYGGSYNLSDPQSLNRYAYTKNDPVNRRDPSGLDDYGLGPPPPVPTLVPYGGTIVTNTWAPAYPVGGVLGGRLLSGDAMAILESAAEGIEPEPQTPQPTSLPDAIKLARQLLTDPKGPCAELFKKGNGLSTLNELDKKDKIKIADTKVKLFGGPEKLLSSMPGVGAVITSKGVFINPAGRIAQGKPSPTGPFGKLSPLEAMAGAIIHETAHKTGDFGYEAAPIDSTEHSIDVVDKCFGGRLP